MLIAYLQCCMIYVFAYCCCVYTVHCRTVHCRYIVNAITNSQQSEVITPPLEEDFEIFQDLLWEVLLAPIATQLK